MKSATKVLAGITLALGIVAVAFLAQPIQANFHGNGEGDELQIRRRSSLRTSKCDESGDALRRTNQSREMPRTCACACNCSGTQQQTQLRQGTAGCPVSRMQNSEMAMNQFRSRRGESTRTCKSD